ncbi:MAG: D-alanine--D-alanine ligase [Desulfovibrionaceae bacterium]|nr:D-alanine--D-alanine ligase [Desulfovibrionaceae bacterium]
MNILLIAGGWSDEREVSLGGAKGIAASLERQGHRISLYDPQHDFTGLPDAAKGQNFAFIHLHGAPGEDGLPQSLLERLGLPYQGSGPAASFLALNKAATKTLYRQTDLPTPEWIFLCHRPGPGWTPSLSYPLILKHNTGGSSLRLAKANDPEELADALDRLFAGGGEILVEEFHQGIELTCAVLGELTEKNGQTAEIPQALPPILIRPLSNSEGLFDYASKYSQDGAEEICPAPLPEELLMEVRRLALAAHQALGLCGYSRTDFILTPQKRLLILETNTLPGMTTASLLPKAALAAGISFDQLLRRLLDLGLASRRA